MYWGLELRYFIRVLRSALVRIHNIEMLVLKKVIVFTAAFNARIHTEMESMMKNYIFLGMLLIFAIDVQELRQQYTTKA